MSEKLCIDCEFCVLAENKNGLEETDYLCSHEKSGYKSPVTGKHIMDLCLYMREEEQQTEELSKFGFTAEPAPCIKGKLWKKKKVLN